MDDIKVKLNIYLKMLEEYGKTRNLTAIDDEDEVWVRHFEDSAQLLPMFNFAGSRVLDLGSGAGFPGIPIALGEPTIRLTLLDATEKKVEFLRDACEALGLGGVKCLHGRAEELGRKRDMRDGFDFVTARGVARLNALCELALPFLRIGGKLLAMKGDDCDSEIREAENAILLPGGELDTVKKYTLSNGVRHSVVVIRKRDLTPSAYPRRHARIKSKPL